jgi:hypothetical protein
MKTSSAKAKGRRCQQEIVAAILGAYPNLTADDVRSVPASVTGADLWMSPAAQSAFPFVVEAKNVERLNFHEAIAQSESHAEGTSLTPLLVFRRNGEPLRVILRFDAFLNLVKGDLSRGGSWT